MRLLKQHLSLFFLSLFLNHTVSAETIYKCKLPDGSVEFSNQGCSKFSQLKSKIRINKSFKKSKKKHAYKPSLNNRFKHPGFIALQKRLIAALEQNKPEPPVQAIIDDIKVTAQTGRIDSAFDMVAATYVALSKYIKKKQWTEQKVNPLSEKIRQLFENILISQSTTANHSELLKIIQEQWSQYQIYLVTSQIN